MPSKRLVSRCAFGVAVLGFGATSLTACSSGGHPAAAARSAPPASARPSPASPTPSSPAAPEPSPSTYTVSTASLSGKIGNVGDVTYTATYPLLEGGPNASEIDAQIARAVQVNLAQLATSGSARLSASAASFSELGPFVAALPINYDAQDAANLVVTYTLVFDLADGKPVPLSQVFTNEQAGLDALSAYVRPVLAARIPDYNPRYGLAGSAPIAANFANWLPTPGGMQILFEPGQVGFSFEGLQRVTVPWDRLPLSSFAEANLTP